MNQKNKHKPFDALTVTLEDSNLIEASAGTGKTYSIAILALRLVLEKKIPIREILMVTFTKAAVAELEERVRLFIRTAHKCSLGKPIRDPNIQTLVSRAIAIADAPAVQQRLREAVLFLDETAVSTIHGFCQQTLLEYAFETNQLFGAELVPDITPILESELNQFWRRHVTTMEPGLLERLMNENDEMKWDIQHLLREHLSGKSYLGFDEKDNYAITPAAQKKWLRQLAQLNEKIIQLQDEMHAYILENKTRLQTACESNTYAKKSLLQFLPVPADFVQAIAAAHKRGSAYIVKLFSDIVDRTEAIKTLAGEGRLLLQEIHFRLNCLAIKEVGEGIALYKAGNNILSYDDLIDNLHSSLVKRDNPPLEAAMKRKYKAVFVDEFQDTDRQQYEIFNKAFGADTILFYIGDPKQSIYGWRKADIFTYFQARNGVRHVYTMNRNFRSSANLTRALNHFFLPTDGFDTFFFGGEGDMIAYIPVESALTGSEGLLKDNTPQVPLSIRVLPKDRIAHSVAALAAGLLGDPANRIPAGNASRSILPSDIGILVRKGREGREIKTALSRLGIPAVILDDAKVLQSEEASYLLYLLSAVESPGRANINRALLSPFTGYTTHDIRLLDDEAVITLFSKYRRRWHEDGIYTALMDFMSDFGVRHVLLRSDTENGERIITNLMQLAELVHQVENRKTLSMTELISWLRRSIDGMTNEGDEYVQRVENDEEAVRIVTIHKSKGLEYKIVLAPYLEFIASTRSDFASFRDPATGSYVGAEKDQLTEEQHGWYMQQSEQENRRLLYVTLTRAVYKLYIFKDDTTKKTTLSVFTDLLKTMPVPEIAFEEGEIAPPTVPYRPTTMPERPATSAPVRFSLLHESWRRLSYTQLAAKLPHTPRLRPLPVEDPYDNFIFHTLKRGVKTGFLIHFILENIHFSDDSRWEKWIEEGIRRHAPGERELYMPMLQRMLTEILNAAIGTGTDTFSLSSVSRSRRITEFEFDFPLSVFRPSELNALADPEKYSFIVKDFREGSRMLEGIMNGKMDLFFEYNDRYYILDWKTNYLGAADADYSGPALAEAMRANNYHLQYLIYTLAAKKYLESRLPGFDYTTGFGGVIYCFIRGARAGTTQGIFTTIPPLDVIDRLEDLLTSS